MPSGDLLPYQQVYDLSSDWYGGRLDLDWRRPAAAEAQAILRAHGFDGPFWDLV